MSSTREPVSEAQQQEKTQFQWFIEVVRKFGTPPLAFSLDSAAELLDIGRTKLDRLIALGLIRVIHYEPGDHPKITRGELDRFLEERDAEARAAAASVSTEKKPTRMVRAGSANAAAQEVEKLRALRAKRRRRS